MESKNSIFSGMKKLAGVLKFLIPGGKLSLQSKYTQCFIYNFTACLDHKALRLLSLLHNTDLQAHSWLILSHFCVK